jgi:hypothetical protein
MVLCVPISSEDLMEDEIFLDHQQLQVHHDLLQKAVNNKNA